MISPKYPETAKMKSFKSSSNLFKSSEVNVLVEERFQNTLLKHEIHSVSIEDDLYDFILKPQEEEDYGSPE